MNDGETCFSQHSPHKCHNNQNYQLMPRHKIIVSFIFNPFHYPHPIMPNQWIKGRSVLLMQRRHLASKNVNSSGGAIGPPTDTSHPSCDNKGGKNVCRFDFPSPYKTHRLESSLFPTFVDVTKEDMLGYLRSMLIIRRMEMAADALYKARMIRGFCHLSTGQVNEGMDVLIVY